MAMQFPTTVLFKLRLHSIDDDDSDRSVQKSLPEKRNIDSSPAPALMPISTGSGVHIVNTLLRVFPPDVDTDRVESLGRPMHQREP